MIEGYDIICFSNDWDGDPLSKKHIMTRLARRNRVLWVNSIGNRNPTASVKDARRVAKKIKAILSGCREVASNIHVISPLAIPFHGNAIARRINRHLLVWVLRGAARRLGFQRPITWTFLPSSADVVGRLGEQMVVYHCTDEFSEFSDHSKEATRDNERRLIEKSDRVIVSAECLLSSKAKHNPDTRLVCHGVDVEHFRKACDPQTRVPEDIARIPGPIVGFFGLIADWVDLELIRCLAVVRPSVHFVLIGKVNTNTAALTGIPNVHFLGQKSYADLPGYCRAFDVAILPFTINELTRNANPLKLREYLAAGLPVLATSIPEVERFRRLVRICGTTEEFLSNLDELIARKGTGPRMEMSREMDAESWDEKVEEMSRIIKGEHEYTAMSGCECKPDRAQPSRMPRGA
jgi:glycosyltransferase involved in cell wall biosynthesis